MRGAVHTLPQYVFVTWFLSNAYVFMAWYLVKHRDNFTFTFTVLCVNAIKRAHNGDICVLLSVCFISTLRISHKFG
jgi:hypothetical protein